MPDLTPEERDRPEVGPRTGLDHGAGNDKGPQGATVVAHPGVSGKANGPSSIAELIWRLRYLFTLVVLALPLICKFFGVEIQIGQVVFNKTPIASPPGVTSVQRPPPPPIATFTDIWPRTDLRTEWGIFTDTKFLGRSSIWYETVKHPDQRDFFVRIHFRLNRGRQPLAPDAYCGIFADWTQPPPAPIDASQYSGLTLRAAYSLSPNTAEVPKFLLNLATVGTNDGEYQEADFTRQLLPPKSGFAKIELPFSSFQTPKGVTTGDHPLDPSKLFRIAIIIKGQQGVEGYLDVDDISFM